MIEEGTDMIWIYGVSELNIVKKKNMFSNCAEEACSVFHFEGKQFKGKESDPP